MKIDLSNIVFEWNNDKNNLLLKDRNVCFEDIINSIDNNMIYDIIENPSKNFDWQFSMIVNINNYTYLVPFIFNNNKIFLKTIYPSRKHNKIYNNK